MWTAKPHVLLQHVLSHLAPPTRLLVLELVEETSRSKSSRVSLQPLNIGGQKNRTRKKTNSWERRFPGTFRTNIPLILPIFSVFSVGGGPKSSQELCSWELFFLILGGFSPSETWAEADFPRGMIEEVGQVIPLRNEYHLILALPSPYLSCFVKRYLLSLFQGASIPMKTTGLRKGNLDGLRKL